MSVWRIGFSFYLKLSEIAKCGLRALELFIPGLSIVRLDRELMIIEIVVNQYCRVDKMGNDQFL